MFTAFSGMEQFIALAPNVMNNQFFGENYEIK